MSELTPDESSDDNEIFRREVWEMVHDGTTSVRRMHVPGGWLYQVELHESITNISADHPDHERSGWHPPVFVPVPR